MQILKEMILGVTIFSFGIVTSGGFAAFISMIGVIPRLAILTKTEKRIIFYENSLICGLTAGNLCFLYPFQIKLPVAFLIFPGVFAGIFAGCLSGALSEVLNTIPVFSERICLKKGIRFLIPALAAGKGIGCLIQLYLF